MRSLAAHGMSVFDVASPAEFAAARAVSPVRTALYASCEGAVRHRLALEKYGIRVTAVDHEDEVAKILRIVNALDLDPEEFTLFVRIASKGEAAYELFQEVRRRARPCGEICSSASIISASNAALPSMWAASGGCQHVRARHCYAPPR